MSRLDYRDSWPPLDVGAVVSSVVLTADVGLQQAAVDYWDMSSAGHTAVVSQLREVGGDDVGRAVDDVLELPADGRRVRTLAELVARRLATGDDAWSQVAEQALSADGLGRLAAHVGVQHDPDVTPVSAEELRRHPVAEPAAAREHAPICVVVPFRDRTTDTSRLRNLLACLHALLDQSVQRDSYRVVVVEQDDVPRWADAVRPLVDQYVHLAWAGHFNKAWAVNVGVMAGADAAELVCVLDADVLVDRDFVERNAARFRVRGAQAHLPFRDALCLDGPSSHRAVRDRVLGHDALSDPESLRGAVLRRPPGHCVWVRRGLFDRVGGFDERFVGWGGEDLDFVFRLDVVGAVDRYGDVLLHLFHERPQTQEDGRRFYAGRRLLSWSPTGPIGQLAGPVASTDDDVAGLIERVDAGSAVS